MDAVSTQIRSKKLKHFNRNKKNHSQGPITILINQMRYLIFRNVVIGINIMKKQLSCEKQSQIMIVISLEGLFVDIKH